jgi:AbrB family looped-hinge helix DNA binding protein
MIQTLVSSKYQIVIPKKVRKQISVKPGQRLNVYLAGDQIILSPKRNWPNDYLKDLRGLWRSIDIKTFVEMERNSWDQ